MSELSLIDKLTLQLNQDWMQLNQIKGFEVQSENQPDPWYLPRYRREAWLKIFHTINDAGLDTGYNLELRSNFERGEIV